MDSKKDFLKDILGYYNEINNGTVPEEVIKKLSEFLSDYYFSKYRGFRRQYPKSKKRYSKMKISDLEMAYTHDKIIGFMKKSFNDSYAKHCSVLIKMNLVEFIEYEKSRDEFYDMF